MKSILLPLFATALIITVLGAFGAKLGKGHIVNPLAEEPKIDILVKGISLKVKVADEEQERMQGLSDTSSLPEGEGMLFDFEKKDIYPSFWMKDMRIAIDIIWINDGKVTKIDRNIPAPDGKTPQEELKLYYPEKPIDYVLEVNAGFSDKNGVEVGSEVGLPDGI
jgi:hypothetical protein